VTAVAGLDRAFDSHGVFSFTKWKLKKRFAIAKTSRRADPARYARLL
jgi:hypothetical protein